ncbi:hypothetical protein AVEN_13809-1 [Araneus ventricosus]|uniref:Uncharacterized protein n=1 Tax=Araneus ventricosus TaxID=182803 RepID=A0A4Y2MD90_ARAVE|nr:hypothetical protein AVEN_13809-1 [Araneus ventricosus]
MNLSDRAIHFPKSSSFVLNRNRSQYLSHRCIVSQHTLFSFHADKANKTKLAKHENLHPPSTMKHRSRKLKTKHGLISGCRDKTHTQHALLSQASEKPNKEEKKKERVKIKQAAIFPTYSSRHGSLTP